MANTSKASGTDTFGQARECIRNRQFDEAEKLLHVVLQEKETADALRNLALVHRARGDAGAAMACLEKALALEPRDHAAVALIGELYFDHGDSRQAIGHYVLAMKESPATLHYKERFLALAGMAGFHKHNEEMQGALLACLETPGLDCSGAQILWYTLLAADPEFSKLYKFSNSGSYVGFNQKAFDKADWKPLLAPFFVEGLQKIAVYHPVFESFLTHLRLRLMQDYSSAKPRLPRAELARLGSALAQYCFYTEYIFATTQEEVGFTASARARLEGGDAGDAALVALYACYAPLHGLSNAAKRAGLHPSALSALQIVEHAELEALKKAIVPLTEISAGVSAKVREQYEEFPYPRWKNFYRGLNDEEVEGRLKNAKAKILVAGCGTGREAIQLAAAFPDASVLAVDLSLTSLAYAIKRAKELGVANISFRQADILKLGAHGEKYDYVSSSGVLHHLENPLEGWKILCGLLKDEGLMRIALYSETARRHLVAAHKIIAKQGFKPDAAGMRQFRAMTPQLLDRAAVQDILNRPDSYHLSMYRDLLFNVQEHRFDIPEINAALQGLGLDFIKFFLPQQTEELFRKKFADEKLENWHLFEQENPDTFSAMYQFWCSKKN